MRAFIVSIVLAVAVVVCVAFVALFAGPNVSSAMLASLGLAISMVAALFAAIAALGPKFRPTPVLTPAIAGTAAAALTTVAIVAGSAYFGQAHRAAMHAGEPARVTTPPAEVQSKASGPAPIPFPRLTDEPALPTPLTSPTLPSEFLPGTEAEPPMPEPGGQPDPLEADIAETVIDETAGPNPDDTPDLAPIPADGSAQSNGFPDAAAPLLSSPPASLMLSEDIFDASETPLDRNGSTAPNPPLPRSRPCGAGGPPCP